LPNLLFLNRLLIDKYIKKYDSLNRILILDLFSALLFSTVGG